MTSLKEQSAKEHFSLGFKFYKQEDFELAIKEFTQSVELNPIVSDAYSYRGDCYKELKEYPLALTDFNEAIHLTNLPVVHGYNFGFSQAEIYYLRAFCYVMQKNYKPALKDFDNAIRLSESLEEKKAYYNFAIEIAIEAAETNKARDYVELRFENSDSEESQHKPVYLLRIETAEERDSKNKELEKTNEQLKFEISEKEKVQHRMQKLVEQFTHTLGNVIFPDTIYQVAERLKNKHEYRKDVLLLHEAYHSEIIIKLQGELLRLRYANSDPKEFRQLIRSCRRTPNAVDNIKSIEDILDYAASRVTARFLNQHYAGLNSIRDKILSKKNGGLNDLRQKFEDDILLNKSLRPIAWINENLRPVKITEISPLWKKVFILSESHAEALLFGYFSEILYNAFKYADHDKDEFLTLVFDEKTINDTTYLSCSWGNPVKDKAPSRLGTGKGLDAIQEDLKQLNDTENPEESLLISQQKNQFPVTLHFKRDLLYKESPSEEDLNLFL